MKKKREDEDEIRKKKIIKTIIDIVHHSYEQWSQFLLDSSQKPSLSTVSGWAHGTHLMRDTYRKNLKKHLLHDPVALGKEQEIRAKIMEVLKVDSSHADYFRYVECGYSAFLDYALFDEKLDIRSSTFTNPEFKKNLLMLFENKINQISSYLGFSAAFEEVSREITLSYPYKKQGHTFHYKVDVFVYVPQLVNDNRELIKFCQEIYECGKNSEAIISYVFVMGIVEDELYENILNSYRILLLPLEPNDLNVQNYFSYIMSVPGTVLNEDVIAYNRLAEAMLEKITKSHLIVLKEILSKNYDINQVGKNYFSLSSGVWKYKLTMKKELQFEEEILKRKVQEYKRELNILDLNLTGGMFGLRLSGSERKITCADVSPGCQSMMSEILEQYNKANNANKISHVQNAKFRLDHGKFLGIQVPEGGYDLIIMGLGSASYIPDLAGFVRDIRGLLKEKGCLFLSVYNRKAMVSPFENADNSDFKYMSNGKIQHCNTEWQLDGNLYSYKDIISLMSSQYTVLEAYSYPTLIPLLLQGQPDSVMRKVSEIDKAYALTFTSTNSENGDLIGSNKKVFSNSGKFNIVFCQKFAENDVSKYYQYLVNKYMGNPGVVFFNHKKALSRNELIRALNYRGIFRLELFVKAILWKDHRNELYFFVLLPLNYKIKRKTIETWGKAEGLNLKMRDLELCTEQELIEFGFTSGSISCLSYPILDQVVKERYAGSEIRRLYLLCASELVNREHSYYYTYSGNVEQGIMFENSVFQTYLGGSDAGIMDI